MVDLPRAHGRKRRLRAPARWLWWGAVALFAYLVAVPVIARWDIPRPFSQLLGIAVASMVVVPFEIITAAKRSRDYGDIRVAPPVFAASTCAASTAVAVVLIHASGWVPPFGGIALWATAAAAVVWTGTFRWARESHAKLLRRTLKTRDPVAAASLAVRCYTLLDEELTGEQRATVEISLATALIALSARADQEDALEEAAALLIEAGGTAPPALAFDAATRLVDAMRVKLERTGDDTGYEQALDIMMEIAERAAPVVPETIGAAFAARAAWIGQLAAREPDAQRAELLRSAALESQQRAVSTTPEGSTAEAVHLAVLAQLSGSHPYEGDLDAAITACRAAVRRLRGDADDDRALAMLVLAELLELRALRRPEGGIGGVLDRLWPSRPRHGIVDRLWPDRGTHDLARALLLCMRAGALRSQHAAEAKARLPRLRALLIEASGVRLTPLLDRAMGHAYSRLFADQANISGSRAADIAASWAQWAAARGDDQQAAEAWWCWVTAIAADLRRRVLHDKERRILKIQGVTVQAADALARAGRLRDAALALDLGRAVLLTERMHRDRDDLEQRLVAAGQLDLAAQWRAAGQLIERTDRDAFEATDDVAPPEPTLASTEYIALTEHERLLREISRIPGFDDVDAPLDYDDLREAAGEGPLVYLAASDRRGFALVVSRSPQPALVELPGLDRDWTQQRAARLNDSHTRRAVASELEALLPTLCRDVVVPLADELGAGSLVTLIPVGAAAQLPIHAAGAGLGEDRVWRDRTGGTMFRYAPNARVLLRAQRTTERLRREPARLLSACVPDAPGHRRLPRATAESDGVTRCFPAELTERPRPATVASVRRCLDVCTVWHFACHGIHDSASPLDSRLELADGPLTLRAMFAAPAGRRRLAVLSACETAKIDETVPDEGVGFAGAMLQAGVAGVVSSHAAVADDAATLLVLAFFARLRDSGSPARALAGAQAWLRTATNADINARFPNVHEPPDDEDDPCRWRAYRPFADPSSWALFSYTGA